MPRKSRNIFVLLLLIDMTLLQPTQWFKISVSANPYEKVSMNKITS